VQPEIELGVNSRIAVLLDGWPLIHQPNSPAALHLHSLLAYNPADVEAILALPGEPPEWLAVGALYQVPLSPQDGETTPDTPGGRLRWEQRTLPAIARKCRVDLIHLTGIRPPLFSNIPCLTSPAESLTGWRTSGFLSRVREAMGAGGRSRLAGVLWPSDLPPPFKDIPLYQVPPVVPPPFWEALAPQASDWSALDLPDTYILFHGPQDEGALRRVLEAWSWAAGAVGDIYPLVLLDLAESGQARLRELATEYGVANTVRGLAPMALNMLASVYLQCAAIFHPMEITPWAGAVRLGLACAKPVVTAESYFADALVGPAAYLRPMDDVRGLGAALITVIVEEDLAASLQEAARQRAAAWRPDSFREGLKRAYRSALGVK